MSSCSKETRSKRTCGRRHDKTLLGERGLAKVKAVKIWTDAKRQRHALVGMTPG